MTDVLIVLGPLLIVLLVAWFCYERQADMYEDSIRRVEAERDEAKHESRVFRGLLFPAIARAESGLTPSHPFDNNGMSVGTCGVCNGIAPQHEQVKLKDGSVAPMLVQKFVGVSTAKPTPVPAKRSRLPFRLRFNQARKLTNTPQRKTDALASALEKQSQEKKSNVST